LRWSGGNSGGRIEIEQGTPKEKPMAICPICKSEATEIEPGSFDGKSFSCPNHGEFDVTGSVLSVPAHMAAGTEQWEAALKKAASRSFGGKRPRIVTYDF
jgi:hypothetical protein